MKLNKRLFRFENRIDCLAQTIRKLDQRSDLTVPTAYIVERTVIQFQIEWELFVRCLILDSATGRYEDSRGRVFSKKIGRSVTREQACHELIESYRKRDTEPDWYLPVQAIRAADLLGVTNFPNIATNLGLTPWIIEDLRYIRNYIAHRSKQSALQLRKQGLTELSGRINPIFIVLSYGKSGTQNYS